MRVECVDPSTNMLLAGTVMDIPFPLAPSSDDSLHHYTILFDNGTAASVCFEEMASIILLPPIDINESDTHNSLLPLCLHLNSKITYEQYGQYQKGFLGKRDGTYHFVFKSHVNKQKDDWSVPLPKLPIIWVDMCVEGIPLSGHVSHTFLHSMVSPQQPLPSDPVASFVRTLNLYKECPPTLLKALAASCPDCDVLLKSCHEEKRSLESLDTYHKITLGKYCALREKGTPCAIPTMCILTIERDKNILPLHTKSRVVALGKHKDRVWSKSDKFLPVLHGDSLCFLVSMAIQIHHPFCQGNCTNTFYQGILPPEEVTIINPSSGDPDADPQEYWLLLRTLYGLQQSPHHW